MAAMSNSDQVRAELPDGWEDQTVYTFMGPEDGGFQHMLTLVIDPYADDADLAEYARERIDNAVGSLQGVEILKEEQKPLSGGLEAYECVYKWIPVEGKVILQKQVYAIKDGKGYTFSAGFSRKTIKTIGTQVDRIIESILAGDETPSESQ